MKFVAGELPAAQRQTVEAHVDDCDACRQVLAALVKHEEAVGATTPAPTLPAAGSPTDTGEWTAGAKVGRYVIRGNLGRGGMGAVYRAEDPELGRPVALKRLHAAADAETRARLTREARAAAQLAHPNVVTVYEVGDDRGTPYIAMELVDGVTLTRVAARRRGDRGGTSSRCLRRRVAGSPPRTQRGLVHRDFKPDNVLVDRAGRARVADFGLARAWDERGRNPSRIARAMRDSRA